MCQGNEDGKMSIAFYNEQGVGSAEWLSRVLVSEDRLKEIKEWPEDKNTEINTDYPRKLRKG